MRGNHVDLSGPYDTRKKKKYFMVIKDEFSGYIHVEFIGSKTQTNILRVLEQLSQVDEEWGTTVRSQMYPN